MNAHALKRPTSFDAGDALTPTVGAPTPAVDFPLAPGARLTAEQIETEWLDGMPVEGPRAISFWRDRRPLHAGMFNPRMIAALLAWNRRPQRTILEIGARNGAFSVAPRLSRGRFFAKATLSDRQSFGANYMYACLAWARLWSVALLALGPSAARADEPLFGYVNTTDLLPKGRWQLEQWLTLREGQARGRYHRVEGRSEAEYGLADNLQVTAYLNTSYVEAGRNSPSGATDGPGVPPDHPANRPYRQARVESVTGEVIWRLASPYTQPVGFAVLSEGTAGDDQRSVRLRAIAQKNFLDDTLVLAANGWIEVQQWPVDATVAELDFGASYRLRPKWSAALELRLRQEREGSLDGARPDCTAWFFGPTIHYGAERWFLTASALRQMHADVGDEKTGIQTVDGFMHGRRHTRWDGLRLRVGRTF